jgi:hypothetical protein
MMAEQLIEINGGWRYTSHSLNSLMEEESLLVESDEANQYYVSIDTPHFKGEFLIFPVEGIKYDLERFMSIVQLYKDPERIKDEVIKGHPSNVEYTLH